MVLAGSYSAKKNVAPHSKEKSTNFLRSHWRTEVTRPKKNQKQKPDFKSGEI